MPHNGPPPAEGDVNGASQVLAFTWALEATSFIFVAARMYSRIRLTKNVWWDDWCILLAFSMDVAVSIIWTIYADRGYARHFYYLTPQELPDVLKLNTISRSLCMFSIATAKIGVTFLIERFAGPMRWRKWLLRFISITTFLSAVITLTLFYAQCTPVQAVWNKSMLAKGTGSCLNLKPINTWNLVIASYWAFLDFVLAVIPVDIVWKLQISLQKKIGLSLILGMGVLAGACACVKTAKVPITVHPSDDLTWNTIQLLLWNGMEMNVIILAACVPTLRPLFVSASRITSEYRSRSRSRSYNKNASDKAQSNGSGPPKDPGNNTIGSRGGHMKRPSKRHQIFHTQLSTMHKGDSPSESVTDLNKEGEHTRGDAIVLEERELGSRDDSRDEEEGGEIDGRWHEGGQPGIQMKSFDQRP